MKNLRQFSLLIALVTVGTLLTACTQGDGTPPGTNTPAASPTSSPVAGNPSGAPYHGAVDKVDCETVGGWAMNIADPGANVKVELYIDNKLAETLPADTLRPDLVNKVGTGRYGFTFKTPSAYKDGRPHTPGVKVAGSNYAVPLIAPPTFECKP